MARACPHCGDKTITAMNTVIAALAKHSSCSECRGYVAFSPGTYGMFAVCLIIGFMIGAMVDNFVIGLVIGVVGVFALLGLPLVAIDYGDGKGFFRTPKQVDKSED